MTEFPPLLAIQQLARTYRLLMATFEAQIGHSMPRWRILLLLHQNGEMTQKRLARDLGMDPAALTRQIKAIERMGWVSRRGDAADNRLVHVALTAAGSELVAQTLPRRSAFIEQAFGDLSGDQLKALSDMLRGLEERLLALAPRQEAPDAGTD